MGAYVAQRVVKLLAANRIPILTARVGILGFTFKENVPDIRNSKVVDIFTELKEFGVDPLVHDPMADAEEVQRTYQVELTPLTQLDDLCAIILAVPHAEYESLDGQALSGMLRPNGILIDVKSKVDPNSLRDDITYWSL